MIKLYDFPRSPYCQKVRLVLAEKDLSIRGPGQIYGEDGAIGA